MIRFTEPPLAIACLITSLRKYVKNPAIIIAAMICETVIICVPSLIRDRLQDRIVLFVVIRMNCSYCCALHNIQHLKVGILIFPEPLLVKMAVVPLIDRMPVLLQCPV